MRFLKASRYCLKKSGLSPGLSSGPTRKSPEPEYRREERYRSIELKFKCDACNRIEFLVEKLT